MGGINLGVRLRGFTLNLETLNPNTMNFKRYTSIQTVGID